MRIIVCDQCGMPATEWEDTGGNCLCCGDNLCADCAKERGGWSEEEDTDGYCGYCEKRTRND